MKKALLLLIAALSLFFAGYVLHGDQLKKVDLVLKWQKPLPVNTNTEVYNIRIRDEGSLIYDYKTWPILAVDSNVTTHAFYGIWENQMLAVSHTNYQTGAETTQDIAPVYGIYSSPAPPTNATPRDVVDPLAKQSLKLWWQGPPNWQANGGIFNIRYANGPWTGTYDSWPLWTRVTNILNTIYYNVNPTQFFCITFTNKITGVESGDNISPISGQYNWQGQ